MANNSYSIEKNNLRRLLLSYNISEDTIARFVGDLEKEHRHINVLAFISMLIRSGLTQDDVVNVLRRLGMKDIIIKRVLDERDEQKLSAIPGRIFNASLKPFNSDDVGEKENDQK